MKRAIWPAFLASVLVGFGIFHIWGMTEIAFQTLDFVRNQITEKTDDLLGVRDDATLPVPAWADRATGGRRDVELGAAGRHVRDIPLGKDEGIIALGVNNEGDYAPLIMQADGAVRAAGKNVQTGPEWVPIAVDKQGRVIISPDSIPRLFNLQPGERIIIMGPPAKVQP